MPHVDTPQSRCRFGVARCDITPPVGIYHRMWGAASHDRATGIHRPLTATAMAFRPLESGDERSSSDEHVLVALDHCILWFGEMQALRRAVCEAADLDPQKLTVTFSHTHSAGLMGWEREGLPGGELIRPYLDELARRAATIVREARNNSQPATFTYGYGRSALAAHRDFWDEASGQFVCGFNPGQTAGDTVLVVRATHEMGRAIATIVNYACHPTTLAWENTLISPDYPGAMREVIETATSAPCVFLQGASGDLGPRECHQGDVAVADRNGRQLGYSALAALESLPPPRTRFTYTGPVISGATLGTWKHVPLDARATAANARWRLRRWTIPLPYRPGLATREQTLAERTQWEQREAAARRSGDAAQAADCRAMVERLDRQLVRQAGLTGEMFEFQILLMQIGPAFWLCVEGEPYNVLQTELRRRFPDNPILVCVLCDGSRPSYLPPRELYGRGIYQESIAILAPGSLERVLEAASAEIDNWLSSPKT
jgi:hypothetical protein